MVNAFEKNVLVWERPAGLGDLMQVLAGGILTFHKKPFTLLCGVPSYRMQSFAGYYGHLRALARMVKLCTGVVFLDSPTREDVRSHVSSLKKRGHHVYCVPEEGLNIAERARCYEHQTALVHDLSCYFRPRACSALTRFFRSGKITICFHLRYLDDREQKMRGKADGLRNIDLDKWASFLAWVAARPEVQLIGIGESNPQSPFYIPRAYVRNLCSRKNVLMLPYQRYASLEHDLWVIKQCDLFIGACTGMTSIAMMLGKPVLSFDWGVPWPNLRYTYSGRIQQRYWLQQSLATMKHVFLHYYRKTWQQYRHTSHQDIALLQEQTVKNEMTKAVHALRQVRTFPGLPAAHFYDEVLFNIGVMYMRSGMTREAARLFAMADGHCPCDASLLCEISAFFKAHGNDVLSRSFLDNASIWARQAEHYLKHTRTIIVRSDMPRILAMIGALWQERSNTVRAKEFYGQCLCHDPRHDGARRAMLALAQEHQWRVMVWGTGSCYTKHLAPFRKKLRVTGFIDSNRERWGARVHGVRVYPPSALRRMRPMLLCICSHAAADIVKELEAMRCTQRNVVMIWDS